MRLPALSQGSVFALQRFGEQARTHVLKLLPDEEQGKGVYIRVFGSVDPALECPENIIQLDERWIHGQVNLDERRRFMAFTQEKAWRLARFAHSAPDVVSAWEAGRDRDKHRYGGAIRVLCTVSDLDTKPVWIIIAVSGLNELADEAVAVRLLRLLPWDANEVHLGRVVHINKNGYANQMLRAA